MIANVLSIAGVDPSGGAGIAADLKTFSALGVYGMAVVTAVTAQNTREVTGVRLMDPAFITEQIDVVFGDVRVDAVKIGMVATAEIAAAIADALARHHAQHIVLDPVMIAKSGDRLLAEAAIAALRQRLMPLAEVVTPNLPEGAALLDTGEPDDLDGMRIMAHELLRFGSQSVLLKGGHMRGRESIDVLSEAGGETEFAAPRVPTNNSHGTGCTLSSAIAALLPTLARHDAIRAAKTYLTGALRAADDLTVGSGHGPVHHFHQLWKRP